MYCWTVKVDSEIQDELFHISVYNWLMQSEMTDRLLNIQSAYLESYLIRTSENQPDNISASNMLWKYYEKVKSISSLSKCRMCALSVVVYP